MPMNKQRGFSMIEVLVAFIVLVFGILGMAGLQMQAITATEQGRYNGAAAMQAASISAAMKANPGYWGTPPSATIKVVNTTVTNGPASSTTDCKDATGVTICTATQMAYFDLQTWGAKVSGTLPAGRVEITCDLTTPPAICKIKIIWLEKNIAGRNQATTGSGDFATGATVEHFYQTVVTSL